MYNSTTVINTKQLYFIVFIYFHIVLKSLLILEIRGVANIYWRVLVLQTSSFNSTSVRVRVHSRQKKMFNKCNNIMHA